MRPLVSVVVPMYKCEPYLRKCLDSLINQTLKEIEIICVNDGSPDDSAKIVQEYQKKDDRILLINQKNKGLAETRNVGMKKAHATYIMFCDSDDFYDLDMCEKMYHAINDNDVDIACCGTKIIYEASEDKKKSDERYYKIKFSGKQKISSKHLLGTDVSAWNKIFKIELIQKYKICFPKGLLYEDAPFFFKYLTVSSSMYYFPKKLYNYLRRSGSIMDETFQKSPKAMDHIKIMADIYCFLKKRGLLQKWKKEFLIFYLNSFRFSIRNIPIDYKTDLYQTAWPIMKKFSAQDIAVLPFWQQEQWRQILKLCYNQKKIFHQNKAKLNNKSGSCFSQYNFKHRLTKKDVGLVGLWGNVNYGSVLTNFATYHFIKDYGKSVLLIERPKDSIEEPYVGHIFHNVPYPNEDVSPQYKTLQEMENLNKVVDTFIVNSDILYGEYSVRVFSQFMLLDYIQNSKKKYAYAVSFGFDKFLGNEYLRKKIKSSLQNFKKFTVREQSGINVAKKYFDISAEWVLDPLFLCNVEHFKSFSQKGSALLSGGIGCYILDPTEHDGLKIVEDVSKTLNYKSCIINDYQKPESRVKNVTVEDWLATYFASDFIITDSFHGTCMAIILKKPFIAVANMRRGCTRFESILTLAGLRNHLVFDWADYNKKKEQLLSPIDWKMVDRNMEEKLNSSKEILRNMLE